MKSPEELEKLYVRKIRAYNALAIGYLIGGDRESAKKAVGTMIVLSRRRAREAVKRFRAADEALTKTTHSMRKKDWPSGKVSLESNEIRWELLQDYHAARNAMADVGHELCRELLAWEKCGATVKDLFNLCNRDFSVVVGRLGPDTLCQPFPSLVSALMLDYKAPTAGPIRYDVDAPLTHTILEFDVHALLEMPGMVEEVSDDLMDTLYHLQTKE